MFGGTFNPIHLGHLQVAAEVCARFRLDQIHLIPSAQPPHKKRGDLATAADRYEMVRLATAQQRQIVACDIEILRSGPSYTIDTVLAFKKKMRADGQLFFLVGMDAFLEIDSWKSFRKLFEQIAFIVMTRPGTAGTTEKAWLDKAAFYAAERICKDYRLDARKQMLTHPRKQTIYLIAVEPVDIASSDIRQQVGNGTPIDRWVPAGVADYIREKGLYR